MWRALCASGKPLVGHNLLYDLLFLHDHFEGPLPPTLAACKATLHARLPLIWDTKLLATRCGRKPHRSSNSGLADHSDSPCYSPCYSRVRALPWTGFTETALGPLHAACVGGAPPPPVAVTFPPDFARYDGGEQAHEPAPPTHCGSEPLFMAVSLFPPTPPISQSAFPPGRRTRRGTTRT